MYINDQQFVALLGKFLDKSLTTEEEHLLERCVNEDPERMVLLRYIRENQAESLEEAEEIYKKFRPHDLDHTAVKHLPQSPFRMFRDKRVLRIAVCVICLLAGVWMFLLIQKTRSTDHQWEYVQTTKGQRKFFKLIDGTTVWLNNDSQLKIGKGYGKESRKMELVGEAFFSVAKNKSLPLYIKAKESEIQVLGTMFNVRAYADDKATVTSLIEGVVRLRVPGKGDNEECIMQPGDRVAVSTENFKMIKTTSEVSPVTREERIEQTVSPIQQDIAEIMWVKNKLVFDGDSLDEMAKKLGRWYDKTVIVEDQGKSNQVFTGKFEGETYIQVLDLLKQTGGKLDYRIEKDTIYIK
ncbi:DUF4974 domain-containing protein [Sphingobacterium psychroaquaticum]|uniref:FecR family protein n=1 Tax=Sphingobacterium psychroaquaticum TaxID=561061 RepID=UPI0010695CF9|nr:FecR family protein [Sphingobacterium psychroaquaticum]QBQ41676.1 DUF4974 domain-containing protein [Sphingobacterium psychroaquaticum]